MGKSKFSEKNELPLNLQNLTEEILTIRNNIEQIEDDKEKQKTKAKRRRHRALEISPSINSDAKMLTPQIENNFEAGKSNLFISCHLSNQ